MAAESNNNQEISMISMDKTYRCANGSVPVVKFVDGPERCPVGVIQGEYFLAYKQDGSPLHSAPYTSEEHPLRLIEVGPYDDFAIDGPVMVRDSDQHDWQRVYFAGLTANGAPLAWAECGTKWSAKGEHYIWQQCRRPTAEELAS